VSETEHKTYLSHLAHVAKTALTNPKHVELAQWIGAGPSIRARARFALAAAFLVAAPTLLVGVLRTSGVHDYAKVLSTYDAFTHQVAASKLLAENVRTSLWRFEAQPEVENERTLVRVTDMLRLSIAELMRSRPSSFSQFHIEQLDVLAERVEEAVREGILQKQIDRRSGVQSMAPARLALITLVNDFDMLSAITAEVAQKQRHDALHALSLVGRDQLILFLVLLFAIPVFVGFVPGWLVAPLSRLKKIEQRIEEGSTRDLPVSGNDEISQLARTIKNALVWRERLDQKKSAKIFEIRNVLRAVIGQVREPVLIMDREGKINYANGAAGELIGVETHRLEGGQLSGHLFAPELFALIDNALTGDFPDENVPVNLEFADGRARAMAVRLNAVRDREGELTRIVLVLFEQSQ